MKTEKRLTMALSVLVALMMLAVPLASSSNLFVDGGQTNSNGDAPLSAPSEGYTITFQLNSDGKSLDAVDLTDVPTSVTVDVPAPISVDNNATADVTISFYKNADGDLCAFFIDDRVTIQQVINSLYTSDGAPLITKGKYVDNNADKYAYSMTAWKDTSGILFKYKDIQTAGSDNSPVINKDMTFSAQWLLDEKNCVEVPVKVTFDGETKEYVKAYPYSDADKTKVKVDPGFFKNADVEKIMGVSKLGQSVNPSGDVTKPASYSSIEEVYTYTMKDAKDVDLSGAGEIVVAENTILIDYSLKSTYSKVVVSSTIFGDKEIIMYTKNNTPYTYLNVYYALQNVTDADGNKIFVPSVKGISDVDGSVLVNDGSYKATSWNDGVPIDSTANATSPLTLNATLNSYKVVFMVNGEYEIVTVNYGELTADKCPFDVTGLTGWVMPNTNYTSFDDFYFTESEIADLEKSLTKDTVPVFIAVFTAEPLFAVFYALDGGDFGDNAVTKIVIPVNSDSTVPLPSASPVHKEKTLFIGWKGYDASKKASEYPTSQPSNNVIKFFEDTATYKYTITFYDGSKVVGVFYLTPSITSIGSESALKSAVAAIQYDGKLYGAPTGDHIEGKYTAIDAYNDVLNYDKDGYILKLWNDSADKAMITIEKKTEDGTTTVSFKVNMSSIKSDISLYGQFDAKSYTINYVDTLDKGSISQDAIVDSPMNLYKDTIFNHANDGYTLKQWSTIADGSGTVYALGSSFTLSGADYEKLLEKSADGKVVVTLYSVWEKTGGSDVPGGNTGGDSNDNTALYLIAGMLAVIAILAIVGIVLMRKK